MTSYVAHMRATSNKEPVYSPECWQSWVDFMLTFEDIHADTTVFDAGHRFFVPIGEWFLKDMQLYVMHMTYGISRHPSCMASCYFNSVRYAAPLRALSLLTMCHSWNHMNYDPWTLLSYSKRCYIHHALGEDVLGLDVGLMNAPDELICKAFCGWLRVIAASRSIQRAFRRFLKRQRAARTIQWRWRWVSSSPTFEMCRKRIAREYGELTV
jgi:hypothetical protein